MLKCQKLFISNINTNVHLIVLKAGRCLYFSILVFISSLNSMLSCVEHEKKFYNLKSVISLINSGKKHAEYRKFDQFVIWPFNFNNESL